MPIFPTKDYLNSRKLCLSISFIYVCLGTITICSVYPQDTFSGEWANYTLLMTLPVSFISFGFRYAEPHALLPVFVIQTLMFFPTFNILSRFIRR